MSDDAYQGTWGVGGGGGGVGGGGGGRGKTLLDEVKCMDGGREVS